MASRKAKRKKTAQKPTRKHNTPEAAFQARIIEKAQEHGWEVYHAGDLRRVTSKGFPDLVLAKETGKLIVAELKADKGWVRLEQHQWLKFFSDANVTTYIWRPKDWDTIVSLLSDIS